MNPEFKAWLHRYMSPHTPTSKLIEAVTNPETPTVVRRAAWVVLDIRALEAGKRILQVHS